MAGDGTGGRALRVLVVGLNYAPETTGIAPYTTGLARHLADAGHKVTVVAGHPHYPEWRLHHGFEDPRPAERDGAVTLLRVPHPVPRDPNGLSRVWMELVFAWRAAGHMLRQRADVMIVVTPALLSLAPAILLRRLTRSRVGSVVQDLYGAALRETGLGGGLVTRATARLEAFLLRRVDGVAVIHDIFRKVLVDECVSAERIVVIPNWVHVTVPAGVDRAAVRAKLGWRDDQFIALHAGNMGAKQGLEGLVDVARLAQERDSRVHVVLMGSGSRRTALEERAAGLTHLTVRDGLPSGEFEAALVAADCLVLHEKPGVLTMSVPSKLTSYFSAGRPVVAATDPGSGAASLMRAAAAGPVVAAGDPVVLLAAIEGLATDAALQQALGQNGQRYSTEHLTASASLQQSGEWVHTLVNGPTGTPSVPVDDPWL